jgi:hypothetical protein
VRNVGNGQGIRMKVILVAAATAAAPLCALPSHAQGTIGADFVSVGRGAPVTLPVPGVTLDPDLEGFTELLARYPVVGPFVLEVQGPDGALAETIRVGSAFDGDVPKGIDPLEVDMWTSKDFYQDRELWSDPRYFRCNSSLAIEQQRGASGFSRVTIDDDPAKAAWGYCDRDDPREAIVSPYEFETAQAHYEALLAEVRARGGPDEYTYATLPSEWTGRYSRGREILFKTWYGTLWNQIPTLLSLLTEEYQTRMVQQLYHEGTTNAAQWPGQYCWPEGFMRRFHFAGTRDHRILATPKLVQILTSSAGNFMTNIYVGREFVTDGVVPRLGADVPRWYGETIGFWDGDTIITWTSNIQGWASHGQIEFSSRMQTIEIYTPKRDENGTFVGFTQEAIFYDPEALVEPVRIVRDFEKLGEFNDSDPFVYVECIQTLFPINGRAQPVPPGTVMQFDVLDMYGRPWAEIYEKYWERDMQRPEPRDIFGFD